MLCYGGMAENYVNVQLTINGYHTYYWESERGAEIDFVIQRDGQLIPIEVKSADNTRAKSLKIYMDTYKPAYAIKLSAKNFGFENNKKIVPLYAAFCIWNQYYKNNAHEMWALFYFINDINNKTAKSLENGLMPWSRGLIIIINIINYLFIILFYVLLRVLRFCG